MSREIEASNVALACVSSSSAEAHVVLPTSKSDYGQGTTRSLECASASSLAALCPVHVLQAQHKWANRACKDARTIGVQGTALPDFIWLCGHQSASQQCSASGTQPPRFAAGNADRSTSLLRPHLQSNPSHVPRTVWYRCVEDQSSCMAGAPVLS